jgi:hypothetical protein
MDLLWERLTRALIQFNGDLLRNRDVHPMLRPPTTVAGCSTLFWRSMSRQVNSSSLHQRCWPAWSRPSAVRKASPHEVLRQWVRRTHGVEVKYKTLYTIVRTHFRATLNVPRLSHTKNPEAIPAFRATYRERLQRVLPFTGIRNTELVRLCHTDVDCRSVRCGLRRGEDADGRAETPV